MAKRGARNADLLSVVVLIDQRIFDDYPDLGHLMIAGLQQQFEAERTIKSATERLKFPLSVQWITQKTDENFVKIPNEWNNQNFSLLFVPSSKFTRLVKNAFEIDRGLHNLLHTLTSNEPVNENQLLKIIVFDNEYGNEAGHIKKKKNGSHLDFELKRLQEEQLFAWVTECQVLNGVDIHFEPKSFEEVVVEVIQATKSILNSLKSDEIFRDEHDVWIPKKSGPAVAVAANGVGLMLLWNRYLMQVSKAIGCEQAKMISANPNFSSPSQAFETYKTCSTEKEGEQFLQHCCVVRPPASTRDVLALRGSRPNIGTETSKKVFKVLTSKNGEEKL